MMNRNSPSDDTPPIGEQPFPRPPRVPASVHAARKQIFPNSCGAASLLCIAKELGVEKMPAYEGSCSSALGKSDLELSNTCEQDLYKITSGMTTQRRLASSAQGAGYSLPQHLVFAGRLLGLEMDVHKSPGFFSSVLTWLYPAVEKEIGTVIKPYAPVLRHGEAELKALAVSIAKVPVGLHWVVRWADGCYMDPATGKNAASFDEMQQNARAVSVSRMGYSETGISIVARKGS